MSAEAVTKICDQCGATVYPEHLEAHQAERIGGKLLCPHCLSERRSRMPGATTVAHAGGFAAERNWRRALRPTTATATRCKTFHAKLNDASLGNLGDQISEWVDAQDDVEIKFASTAVGVVEGKHADQHLIVTIFY
jgi:hypothetical protein